MNKNVVAASFIFLFASNAQAQEPLIWGEGNWGETVWSDTIPSAPVSTDSDNDGVIDTEDAFPNDATETLDTDGDGIGNNADTDDDGDGYTDTEELQEGTDPLDKTSEPVPPSSNIVLLKAILDIQNAKGTKEE